jgi:holo-[acyl-carrier protein] synthase
MIAGVGIDLIEIEKIAVNLHSGAYLRKVFTEAEIEECQSMENSIERFAGKFAAKEACMKAVGKGIRQGAWFTQIEVLNEESGAPFVRVSGEMETSIRAIGMTKIHVSVTHSKSVAAAVVILESLDDKS